MNILQINISDGRGGGNKVGVCLKKSLEEKGHKTSLFVSSKSSEDKNIFLIKPPNNFLKPISRLLGKNIENGLKKRLPYFLANDVDLFPSSKRILKTPQFHEADIIHCHNLHSNYFNLGLLQKISTLKPLIWTLHDMWPITAHCAHAFDGVLKKNGFFTCPSLDIYPSIAWHNERYLEWRKKQIYQNSNMQIVVPSKWLKEKVERSILRDKPISLIYNGIDTRIFKSYPKEDARRELEIPQDKKVALSIMRRGQSNPWKGSIYLNQVIEHFKNNRDILFLCLGGLGEKDSIKGIRNISYISDENTLAKYYSAADVLIYPSIADNCPLTVLEAQACGLPIVSFTTGGIPELIEHKKSGYIAEYKNFDDMIKGLDFILNLDQNEYETMRARSIEIVKNKFSIDLMVDNYINLYEEIINRHLNK